MLSTLLGMLFPQKRFNPAPATAGGGGTVSPTPGFYPGMGRSQDTPRPNPEMIAKSAPIFGGYGDPMIGRNENWDGKADERAAYYRANGRMPAPNSQPSQAEQGAANNNAGFYPGMNQGAPSDPTDVASAYEENGGVPYSTPKFYPGGPMTKKQARRARDDAYDAAYESMPLEQKQQKLIQGKAPVEHNLGKRILQGTLRGLAGGGLGGAAAGALTEGFFPGINREMNAKQQLGTVNSQIAARDANRTTDQKYRMGETQIKNIDEDNARQERARQDKATTDAAIDKNRKRTTFFRTHKFFDPAKATESDRRQLAEFSETPETIGKFDFTKPNFKMIGDTEYKYNAQTGALEDTGIKDPTKAVVEYDVTDPNTGVTSKYATTSEKAASLKNQLAATGMQINAAKERQASQQNFTRTENDKNRQLRVDLQSRAQKYGRTTTITNAVNAYRTRYMQLHLKEPSAAEIEEYQKNVEGILDSQDQEDQ